MIVPSPIALSGELTHVEASQQAFIAKLHLVIDREGNTFLTPILLPGMHRMTSADKQHAEVTA